MVLTYSFENFIMCVTKIHTYTDHHVYSNTAVQLQCHAKLKEVFVKYHHGYLNKGKI